MNIVYLSNAAIPSQYANSIHVMKMCQAFAHDGHDVTLIVPDRKVGIDYSAPDVFKYYNVDECFKIERVLFPKVKGNIFVSALHSILMLFHLKPDLVYGRSIIGCVLATLVGYNVIFESHAPIWESSKIASICFNILLKSHRLKKLVVISESLKKEYITRYEIDPNMIQVAHDGADPVDSDVLSSCDDSGKKLRVGYIGHLYTGKGMEVIREIAPLLSDVEFHVIGGLKQDIKYWEQHICCPNIFFWGYVPHKDVGKWMELLDICLLPNQKSVFIDRDSPVDIGSYTSPLKMFEYMSYGKAIIASDLPVLREVLNEKNAILVDPEDFNGWIVAINYLREDVCRDKLGKQALNDFLKNYTWTARVRKLLEN